jgi:hypothetical protein
VCVPLFETVREWLLRGRLDDPHGEFFIATRSGGPAQGGAGASADAWRVWHAEYEIVARALPPFISRPAAETILRAGKSIHFLLQCCGDGAWVMDWATSPATLAAADRISLGQVRCGSRGRGLAGPVALCVHMRASCAGPGRLRDARRR